MLEPSTTTWRPAMAVSQPFRVSTQADAVRCAAVDDVTGEVTELLQQLIRNACVNDGAPDSGEESRNADVLGSYLEGSGIDAERYEPVGGRASLVGRIEGRDPDAPSLLLM